jgi:hypothetical protein
VGSENASIADFHERYIGGLKPNADALPEVLDIYMGSHGDALAEGLAFTEGADGLIYAFAA